MKVGTLNVTLFETATLINKIVISLRLLKSNVSQVGLVDLFRYCKGSSYLLYLFCFVSSVSL